MKLRHLILFFIACAVLILSHLPGGSLLGLFAWLQINTLMTQENFNKSSQRWALHLFLISIPFILFWGSCLSFLFIYLNEQFWLFFIMTTLINFCLCLLANIYFILTFEAAHSVRYKIFQSLQSALQLIKAKKKIFFINSLILFIFSMIPFLSADWKIVFALMATHLVLSRTHLKQVYESGF